MKIGRELGDPKEGRSGGGLARVGWMRGKELEMWTRMPRGGGPRVEGEGARSGFKMGEKASV